MAIYRLACASLRENDGIRPDLTPWLGSLVVDPKYQKQGIGKMLIDVTVRQAKELGFEKLYLFAFDPTIPEYYERLGWRKIGMDEFKSHPVTVMEVEL
jgi:N-acetylglutamate synthase-like GNAT family acetyltransferase